VADIIPIDEKLQLAKYKKNEIVRKRKLLAVKKVFQCTHCSLKCEKCGIQINVDRQSKENTERDIRIPYRFCESCAEEYIDFIERLKGGGDFDCYWHNAEWAASWKKWIDYQGAIDQYTKSKEFLQLLKELKPTRPE
jgi:hypothetical protein